jgi:hypothetical protein
MRQDADIRRIPDNESGTRRRIMPHENAYCLSELTELPWDRVEHSRYGADILEPQLAAPVDEQRRTQQEYALAMGMLGNNTTLETKNWLEQQTQIEEEKSLPPRTAIPATWATNEHLGRALRATGDLKNGIRAIFQR